MEAIVNQVTGQWSETTGEELDADLIMDVLVNSEITSPDLIQANEQTLKATLSSLGVPASIVGLLKKEAKKITDQFPKTENQKFLPIIEAIFEESSVEKDEIVAAREETRRFIISSSFSTASPTLKVSVLRLLQRALCNVIEEPLLEKFRKLSCDSRVMKESLGRMDMTIYFTFLTSLGFKRIQIEDEKEKEQIIWFLQVAKIVVLEAALELINSEAIEVRIEPRIPSKSFNPLNPYAVSTNSSTPLVEQYLGIARESYKTKEYDDVGQKVLLMEEYFITGGDYKDIPEEPIWLEHGRMSSPNVDDCVGDHEIDEIVLDDLKRLILTKPSFKSRRKIILKQLEQRKIYKKARMRFILSDGVTRESPLLEISLHPATSINKLYSKLRKYLNQEDFELFTTPPLNTYDSESAKSLLASNLVPHSIVRVRSTSKKSLSWK